MTTIDAGMFSICDSCGEVITKQDTWTHYISNKGVVGEKCWAIGLQDEVATPRTVTV